MDEPPDEQTGSVQISQHLKNLTFSPCLNERGKYQASNWSSEDRRISRVRRGHVTTQEELGGGGFQMRFHVTFAGELHLTFSKLFKVHLSPSCVTGWLAAQSAPCQIGESLTTWTFSSISVEAQQSLSEFVSINCLQWKDFRDLQGFSILCFSL